MHPLWRSPLRLTVVARVPLSSWPLTGQFPSAACVDRCLCRGVRAQDSCGGRCARGARRGSGRASRRTTPLLAPRIRAPLPPAHAPWQTDVGPVGEHRAAPARRRDAMGRQPNSQRAPEAPATTVWRTTTSPSLRTCPLCTGMRSIARIPPLDVGVRGRAACRDAGRPLRTALRHAVRMGGCESECGVW